jgi:hypothetical protein
MSFRVKSAGTGLRNVCAGLGLCLICCAWSLRIQGTATNTVLISIREPNTNKWRFEFSSDCREWTYCANGSTGTQVSVFYTFPPRLFYRAVLVP